jgi:hypothetical protein
MRDDSFGWMVGPGTLEEKLHEYERREGYVPLAELELPPWRRVRRQCRTCPGTATSLIRSDRLFWWTCEAHYEETMDELTEANGGAVGLSARMDWGRWVRSLYWRPRNRIRSMLDGWQRPGRTGRPRKQHTEEET